MKRRHWSDGPGPWWINGAWWALIGAGLLGGLAGYALALVVTGR